MEHNRKCTKEEIRLIGFLAEKANFRLDDNWEENIWAHPLTDKEVGSIGILYDKNENYTSKESFEISSCKFNDTDGIDVVAYLLVDADDNLNELDIWKCDYSIIKKVPDTFECME